VCRGIGFRVVPVACAKQFDEKEKGDKGTASEGFMLYPRVARKRIGIAGKGAGIQGFVLCLSVHVGFQFQRQHIQQ
jgi:hypothetical protein